MHPGLSGFFLFNICYPGIAVNSISFHSPKCPIWTIDYITALVITLPALPSPRGESCATNEGLSPCLLSCGACDYHALSSESWQRNRMPLQSPCLRGLQPGPWWAACSAGVETREGWGLFTSSDLPLWGPRRPGNNQPELSSWMWRKVLARLVSAFQGMGCHSGNS